MTHSKCITQKFIILFFQEKCATNQRRLHDPHRLQNMNPFQKLKISPRFPCNIQELPLNKPFRSRRPRSKTQNFYPLWTFDKRQQVIPQHRQPIADKNRLALIKTFVERDGSVSYHHSSRGDRRGQECKRDESL